MGVLNPVPQKDASKIVMGKLQLCTVVANCSHRSATSKLCDKKTVSNFLVWFQTNTQNRHCLLSVKSIAKSISQLL